MTLLLCLQHTFVGHSAVIGQRWLTVRSHSYSCIVAITLIKQCKERQNWFFSTTKRLECKMDLTRRPWWQSLSWCLWHLVTRCNFTPPWIGWWSIRRLPLMLNLTSIHLHVYFPVKRGRVTVRSLDKNTPDWSWLRLEFTLLDLYYSMLNMRPPSFPQMKPERIIYKLHTILVLLLKHYIH